MSQYKFASIDRKFSLVLLKKKKHKLWLQLQRSIISLSHFQICLLSFSCVYLERCGVWKTLSYIYIYTVNVGSRACLPANSLSLFSATVLKTSHLHCCLRLPAQPPEIGFLRARMCGCTCVWFKVRWGRWGPFTSWIHTPECPLVHEHLGSGRAEVSNKSKSCWNKILYKLVCGMEYKRATLWPPSAFWSISDWCCMAPLQYLRLDLRKTPQLWKGHLLGPTDRSSSAALSCQDTWMYSRSNNLLNSNRF